MGFPNDTIDDMATSLTADGRLSFIWLWGGQFPFNFGIVIPNIPLYKGMVG